MRFIVVATAIAVVVLPVVAVTSPAYTANGFNIKLTDINHSIN